MLATKGIRTHDNFFDLGGHSLLSARLVARIEEQFGVNFSIAKLFEAPTIAEFAALIRGETAERYPKVIVPIQPEGSRPAFFWVGAGPAFLNVARRMDPEQPFFGLDLEDAALSEVSWSSVRDISGILVESILAFRPAGPFYLGGYSMRGLFAYEVAFQLRAQGYEVPRLVLLDTFLPEAVRRQAGIGTLARAHTSSLLRQVRLRSWHELSRHTSELTLPFRKAIRTRVGRPRPAPATPGPVLEQNQLRDRLRRAAAAYVPQPYPGPITLLEAATQPLGFEVGPRFGWATLAAGGFEVRTVPGAHERLLEEVNLDGFAAELSGCIQVAPKPAKIVLAKGAAT